MLEQYLYEYEHDDYYCYPDSGVLKNRLEITDQDKFYAAERQISSLRMAELLQSPPSGKMTYAYLKKLHKYIFGDIYEWAGKTRKVNISKGNRFCDALYIEDQMRNLMKKLENENYLQGLTKPELAERMAYYIGEINAVHPFREGNGRAQRLFITILAYRNGYQLDLQNVSSEQMYEASVQAFMGDYVLMKEIFLNRLK